MTISERFHVVMTMLKAGEQSDELSMDTTLVGMVRLSNLRQLQTRSTVTGIAGKVLA
jgi:hypothetical protein